MSHVLVPEFGPTCSLTANQHPINREIIGNDPVANEGLSSVVNHCTINCRVTGSRQGHCKSCHLPLPNITSPDSINLNNIESLGFNLKEI